MKHLLAVTPLLLSAHLAIAAPMLNKTKIENNLSAIGTCANQTLYFQVLNKKPNSMLTTVNTIQVNTNIAKVTSTDSQIPNNTVLHRVNTGVTTYKLTFNDPNTNITSFLSTYPLSQNIAIETVAGCTCTTLMQANGSRVCESGIQIAGFSYSYTGQGTSRDPYRINVK